MGKSKMKKVLAVLTAVTVMMAFTVTGAFAASSPSKGTETVNNKPVGEYTVDLKAKTATFVKVKDSKAKSAKTKVIYETISYNGKSYKLTSVAAKAFGKCKKLKTLKIKWKSMKGRSFSKKAFKGLKKSQIAKIKVRVNKKMSKKDFKKLVKMLRKAGIKKKNIKKNLTV